MVALNVNATREMMSLMKMEIVKIQVSRVKTMEDVHS
jgi:hypothetical protein